MAQEHLGGYVQTIGPDGQPRLTEIWTLSDKELNLAASAYENARKHAPELPQEWKLFGVPVMTIGAFAWLGIVGGILGFGRWGKWSQAKAAAIAAQQAGYTQQAQYAAQGPARGRDQGAGVEVPAGAAGSVRIPTLDEDGNPPANWDSALYNHQRPAA